MVREDNFKSYVCHGKELYFRKSHVAYKESHEKSDLIPQRSFKLF